MTFPTAFAAPVEAGMMFADAQRPARLNDGKEEIQSMGKRRVKWREFSCGWRFFDALAI